MHPWFVGSSLSSLVLQVDLVAPASAPVPPLQPHPTNLRVACENTCMRAAASAPAFAVEQEYCVLEEEPANGGCWPHPHLPDPSKPMMYGPQGAWGSDVGIAMGWELPACRLTPNESNAEP